MKFKQGDVVISGPYLIRADGKPGTPQDHLQAAELALISEQRGAHMILAVVQDIGSGGFNVEARYLAWDRVMEPVDRYNLNGITYLPADSRDYKMTDLLDREQNNVNRMIAWLQYDGQQAWIAEHQPEATM